MKSSFFMILILIVAGVLRSLYCCQIPVSGDESVSLLQSSGKALLYHQQAPVQSTRIEKLQAMMKYSPEYGIKNVLESMEKAGAHPPVYYVILHYLLRFFGNGAFLCRLPSILFSTLSVLMLYLLCKRLFGTTEALLAAVMLAVSAYGVHYSHMIRPYPMMMFISISSTWLMLKMYQEKTIRFSSGILWVYLLVTVLGLYGIYHYVFTVLFQSLFLIFVSWKNKKQTLTIISVFCLAGLLYLPWIPSFMTQLRFVNNGELYFHGVSNPVAPLRFLYEFNLTQAMPGDYAWYKLILLSIFFAFTVMGLMSFLSTTAGRYFTITVGISFIAVYTADLIMRTNTIRVTKLLFFLAPVFFIYFSAGAMFIIRRIPRLGLSLTTVLLIAVCVNTALTIRHPKAEDGPQYLAEYQQVIDSVANRDTTELLILNQTNVRYTLSFAHVIKSGDIVMHTFQNSFKAIDEQINVLKEYDWIFIVAPRIRDALNEEAIVDIQKCMERNHFTLRQPDKGKHLFELGCLLVFQNEINRANPEDTIQTIINSSKTQTLSSPCGTVESIGRHTNSQSRTYNFAQN